MSEEVSEAEIRQLWPLHLLVWKDDHKALDRILQEKQVRHGTPGRTQFTIRVHMNMHAPHSTIVSNWTPVGVPPCTWRSAWGG